MAKKKLTEFDLVDKKVKRKVQDLLSTKDYTTFVEKLGDLSKDPKVMSVLESGLFDGIEGDEKFKVKTKNIPVSELRPTQNEIDLFKSLEPSLQYKFPGSLEMMLKGKGVEIMAPVVVLNDKYILDGHHRWSQTYAMNPDATISALVFEKNIDPKKMLKILQMAIATQIGKVPTASVEGINMLKSTDKEVRDYVKDNVSDKTIEILHEAKKIQEPTKDAVADYVVESVSKMKRTSKPIKDAPSRDVMPQTPDAKGSLEKTERGEVNYKRPFRRGGQTYNSTFGDSSSKLDPDMVKERINSEPGFKTIPTDIWGKIRVDYKGKRIGHITWYPSADYVLSMGSGRSQLYKWQGIDDFINHVKQLHGNFKTGGTIGPSKEIVDYLKDHTIEETFLYNNRIGFNKGFQSKEQYNANHKWISQQRKRKPNYKGSIRASIENFREGGPVDLDYYWVTPINFETKTGGNPLIDPGYYHPYVSFGKQLQFLDATKYQSVNDAELGMLENVKKIFLAGKEKGTSYVKRNLDQLRKASLYGMKNQFEPRAWKKSNSNYSDMISNYYNHLVDVGESCFRPNPDDYKVSNKGSIRASIENFETGGVVPTDEAIMLEDGFVYIKLSNGNYSDGANTFPGKLFDMKTMTADIENDPHDPWKFEIYDKNHTQWDPERLKDIREGVEYSISEGFYKTGGSVGQKEIKAFRVYPNGNMESRKLDAIKDLNVIHGFGVFDGEGNMIHEFDILETSIYPKDVWLEVGITDQDGITMTISSFDSYIDAKEYVRKVNEGEIDLKPLGVKRINSVFIDLWTEDHEGVRSKISDVYSLCNVTAMKTGGSVDPWIKNGDEYLHPSGWSVQLHLKKGDKDWDDKVYDEDRYIVLDSNGYDAMGEHMTLENAKSDIIDMEREGDLYREGGSVQPELDPKRKGRFVVTNPDGMIAHREEFTILGDALKFYYDFPKKYKEQGYYRTNRGHKIPWNEIRYDIDVYELKPNETIETFSPFI